MEPVNIPLKYSIFFIKNMGKPNGWSGPECIFLVGSVTFTVSVGDAVRLRGVFCCDCPQRPDVIRQSGGHGWCLGLPPLDRAVAMGGFGLRQRLATDGLIGINSTDSSIVSFG